MVIDTNNINSGSTSSTRSRPAATPVAPDKTASAPTAGASTTAKDNVVLSQEAQRLNRLQANIAKLPDVNAERVAALKQAIAEGRFEINADRIAENMLKQDDLLG